MQGININPDSYMPVDQGDEGMAEGVDIIDRRTLTKKRPPRTMLASSYHQPDQPSQQDHAPSYSQQTQSKG